MWQIRSVHIVDLYPDDSWCKSIDMVLEQVVRQVVNYRARKIIVT